MGGTGNQMFQYAFGKRLATQFRCPLKFDLSFLESRDHDELYVPRDYSLDVFGINGPFYDYQNGEGVVLESVQESVFTFDPSIIPESGDVLLDGYWQSPKYFEPVESEIRSDFDLSKRCGADAVMGEEFSRENAVCINVRRGDFVNNERSRSFHGVLGMDYINAAVSFIESKVRNPVFYVFSDDMEWCRNSIKLSHPVNFVGHEHAGDRFSRYLYYMAQFCRFIIPNSSFAWWAVWLSPAPQDSKLVVAPKRWFLDESFCFNDLIPKTWHTI